MGKLVLERKLGQSVTLYLPDGEVLGTVTFLKNKSHGLKISLGFDLIDEIKLYRTEACRQDQPTYGSEQSHSQTGNPAHAAKPNSKLMNRSTAGSSTSNPIG